MKERTFKKILETSDLELDTEFTMAWDQDGFSVNCEIVDGNEHFGEHLIPCMLIHYVRGLCRENGISFEQALRTSMGIPATIYKDKVEA